MADELLPGRWLVLGAASLGTSLLLAGGVAAFSMRGVASADRVIERPTPRPTGVTMVREIGGQPRPPTPTVGVAVAENNPSSEPARAAAPAGGRETAVNQQQAAPPPATPIPAAPDSVPPAPAASGPSFARRGVAGEPTSQGTPAARGVGATPTATPNLALIFLPTYGPTATPQPVLIAAPTSEPTATALPDGVPRVGIRISDSSINRGDQLSVSVTASDDVGLDWISWEGLDTDDWQLDGEHRTDCRGKTACSNLWTLTTSRAGRQTLQATARDTAGQKASTQIEVRVRDLPTPTPTKTPTPKAGQSSSKS
jgi:hypothetical protein